MRVAVLHGEVPPDAPADEQDVLVEVEEVARALTGLGHETVAVPLSLDLKAAASVLSDARPDIVFNLVESIDGKGRLIHVCPAMLDALGLPYTGSPTEAVFVTSNKVLAKRTLYSAGIATPGWLDAKSGPEKFVPGAAYIIKSVWEHASIGIDDGSVAVYDGPGRLLGAMEERRTQLGGDCFAEEYIDGREFNISVIESGGEPQVMPPAEIRFIDHPEGGLRLVGYRAKWDENSEEYRNTRRSFIFPESDACLLEELAEISKSCWRLFGLRGYARVDFRVDASGRPWVLEVNVNPCISPDAGFVAAAAMAGIGYDGLVGRILDACLAGQRAKEVA